MHVTCTAGQTGQAGVLVIALLCAVLPQAGAKIFGHRRRYGSGSASQ
jgi:hypothetical protein